VGEAAGRHSKKVSLELGSTSALTVLDDVGVSNAASARSVAPGCRSTFNKYCAFVIALSLLRFR